jgi:acetylornithine deacetylase/succinyl-diaminopimelate desuccinylase-like protein
MKGGLVAMLELLDLFAASRATFAGTLTFLVVSGDLDGGLGTLSAIRRGYQADYVIIPKPTFGLSIDPTIVVAHAGSLAISLAVEGRPAPAYKRLEGESVLPFLSTLASKLGQQERLFNERETEPLMRELALPYPTCISKVSAGDWSGNIMDRLEVVVRFGVALHEDIPAAQLRVQKTLRDIALDTPWFAKHPPSFKVVGGVFPSSAISPSDHPLVPTLTKAALRIIGRKAKVSGASYGSAMAHWNRAGSPCVLYGPGDLRVAHTPNEHIQIRHLHQVAQVLLETVAILLQHAQFQRTEGVPTPEEQAALHTDFLEKEMLLIQERRRRHLQAVTSDSDSTSTSTASTTSTTPSESSSTPSGDSSQTPPTTPTTTPQGETPTQEQEIPNKPDQTPAEENPKNPSTTSSSWWFDFLKI